MASGFFAKSYRTTSQATYTDLVTHSKGDAAVSIVSMSINNPNDDGAYFDVVITEQDGVTPAHYIYYNTVIGSKTTLEGVTRYVLDNGRQLRVRSTQPGVSFYASCCTL